jgi:hypothetical protein
MARHDRSAPRPPADPPAPAPPPAADLDILAASRTVQVGGQEVIIREQTFGEQMRNAAQLAAIVELLAPAIQDVNRLAGAIGSEPVDRKSVV